MKQKLAVALQRFLEPIREKRRYYEQHLDEVKSALVEGTKKAKTVAEATMAEVRTAMRVTAELG